jgi:hypothetical protein
MKIIFLDVDNVLNTIYTTRRIFGCTFVDTRKLLRLRDIVERTGAKIVLSSTWRIADTPMNQLCRDRLREEFERVRCPVWIDTTPHLPGRKRQVEIYEWLLHHEPLESFVIIDDWEKELRWYKDNLVVTTPTQGLTKERAELAIRMLNEGEE